MEITEDDVDAVQHTAELVDEMIEYAQEHDEERFELDKLHGIKMYVSGLQEAVEVLHELEGEL